jgi:WD40 repeat protein
MMWLHRPRIALALLLVWSPAGAQTYRLAEVLKPTKALWAIAISPDGAHLAAATDDADIKIWSLESGDLNLTIPIRPKSSTASGLVYSPDGRVLASGLSDGTVVLWDAATGEHLRSWTASSQAIRVLYSPDGRVLLTRDTKVINLWKPDSAKLVFALPEPVGEPASVAFSPDAKHLAVASSDANIRVWNLESRQLEHVIDELTLEPFSLSWAPDGKLLASAGADAEVSLWNTTTWKRDRILGPQTEPINAIAFSPDGRWIASGALPSGSFRSPAEVRVWDLQSGQSQVVGTEESGLNSVAFTRAGQLLVTTRFVDISARLQFHIWQRH